MKTALDALEQHIYTLHQQTHTMARRLRWWHGLACGLLALALLTWALPVVTADDDKKGLEQRVAALETLLKHFSRKGNDVRITGANLHIRNGLGQTDCGSEEEPIPDCPNGLGNLIVGYNEPRGFEPDKRTGSHNVVVGSFHNFSRFGGLVVGFRNTISGEASVVGGGLDNTASGFAASVSGGQQNTASGGNSSVSGGIFNTASVDSSSVSGGEGNTASGESATSVSGGVLNTALGIGSSVSGGNVNTASGLGSSVSGGSNITQETNSGWAAGSEGDEVFVGNFRSP